MVDCRPKLLSIALFWFISFAASLSVYLILRSAFTESRFGFTGCTSPMCRSCTIKGTGRFAKCEQNEESCRYVVDVLLESDTGEGDVTQAETETCFDCELKTVQDFEEELGENKEVPCIPGGPRERIRLPSATFVTRNTLMVSLSRILLALTICFALFLVIAMKQVFQSELLRFYSRFVLTAWMNLRSALRHPRSPSRASDPLGPTPEAYVAPPPVITSRRRISKLIEGSKLSVNEARALREDGWSCCICLEETDDEVQIRPITRLKCNHATHTECLRMWLETGRAACCLCNADVFSDGTKDQSLSSQGSTASGGDTGLIGSLVVERTDRTPSSPATSVFIDLSQPYSDTVASNDERDGDIESGA